MSEETAVEKSLTRQEIETKRQAVEEIRWQQLRGEEAKRQLVHSEDCAARAEHFADWKQICSASNALSERTAVALETIATALQSLAARG